MKKTLSLLALILFFTSVHFGRVIEKIVARVNEMVITQSEFEERKESLSVRAYQGLSGVELDAALKEIENDTLEAMIREAMLLERAKEMGMVEEKIIEHYMTNFKEQNNIESDEKLDEMLLKEGMTRDDLIQEIKGAVIPQYVIGQEVSSNIEVSSSEIEEYYNSNPDDFLKDPEVEMENIYISGKDDVSRQLADDFAKELKKGTAVVDALEYFNLDSSMGQPRTYEKGDLVKNIEKAAFTMEAGEISNPIETGSGFHIIRIISANISGRIPLDQVREEIIEEVKDEKYRTALQTYMDELENQYFIKIYE